MEAWVNLSNLAISEWTMAFGLELHYASGEWDTYNILAAGGDYSVMKSFPD